MRVRFEPQRACRAGRIESELLPPFRFIPVTMHFTMMSPAQRDNKLITNFAPECPVLRETQVMGVGRSPAANQARLLGDVSDVISISNAARFGESEVAFVGGPADPLRLEAFA